MGSQKKGQRPLNEKGQMIQSILNINQSCYFLIHLMQKEKELDYEIPPTKFILLTGAGFTKNFGGYLAREMWKEIHNSLQRADWVNELNESQSTSYERLVEITKKTFDFGELFQVVVKGKDFIDKKLKDAFTRCVF